MKFEERLVFFRKASGLSREKEAELLGVSRQSIYKWEAGTARPGTENLAQLAKLYCLTLDELVNGPAAQAKAPPSGGTNLPAVTVKPAGPAVESAPSAPVQPESKLEPALKRIFMAVCGLAAGIVFVGIMTFIGFCLINSRLPGDDVDTTPMEEIERKEVDTSNWNEIHFDGP